MYHSPREQPKKNTIHQIHSVKFSQLKVIFSLDCYIFFSSSVLISVRKGEKHIHRHTSTHAHTHTQRTEAAALIRSSVLFFLSISHTCFILLENVNFPTTF